MSLRLIILMEHVGSKCSLDSELFFVSICSIRILPQSRVKTANKRQSRVSSEDQTEWWLKRQSARFMMPFVLCAILSGTRASVSFDYIFKTLENFDGTYILKR